MLCYTYKDFKEIENKSTINELNQSSINVINAISKKVGAPTYRKTPVFRKKKQEISNGSFKKTKLYNKLDEDEINCDKIRELLNKLTKTNYDIISNEIITNITHFIYSRNEIILLSIGNSIFDISSVNKFWVKLYAKLYNDLIVKFPIMKDICTKNFQSFMNVFNDIQIGNEENYDEFCKINKINDKRRSLSLFYTNLYNFNILSNDDMFVILEQLINKMFNYIESKNTNILEEIFENINIILKNIGTNISKEKEKYNNMIEKTMEIYNIINDKKISKKITFKMLDLFEDLNIEL
tara:strand:+ start:4399 stop:5283 length:885 start_codon:yes stop_codon:yes gene_type:complete